MGRWEESQVEDSSECKGPEAETALEDGQGRRAAGSQLGGYTPSSGQRSLMEMNFIMDLIGEGE